jgi:hypothetical protein
MDEYKTWLRDCDIGDIYKDPEDGIESIVLFISEDKMKIITNKREYKGFNMKHNKSGITIGYKPIDLA